MLVLGIIILVALIGACVGALLTIDNTNLWQKFDMALNILIVSAVVWGAGMLATIVNYWWERL